MYKYVIINNKIGNEADMYQRPRTPSMGKSLTVRYKYLGLPWVVTLVIMYFYHCHAIYSLVSTLVINVTKIGHFSVKVTEIDPFQVNI